MHSHGLWPSICDQQFANGFGSPEVTPMHSHGHWPSICNKQLAHGIWSPEVTPLHRHVLRPSQHQQYSDGF